MFIIGIGAELPDGQPHDGRAPDYDDWITPNGEGGRGLNGDILIWHPVLERAFEISSMGIRVDPETLLEQLEIRRLTERKGLLFHRMLLDGELPQTIGGGHRPVAAVHVLPPHRPRGRGQLRDLASRYGPAMRRSQYHPPLANGRGLLMVRFSPLACLFTALFLLFAVATTVAAQGPASIARPR